MVKPEWGLKRKCLKCATFFYDMRKKEFSCPKCGAKYTLDSYEEMKAKQLAKLAKKSAAKIDDEELDEETLLKMTADVPLGEELIGEDGLDILEDPDDIEADQPDVGNIGYDDEEQNEQ